MLEFVDASPVDLRRFALAAVIAASLTGCASFSEGLSAGYQQATAPAPDAAATVAQLAQAGVAADPHTTTAESDPNHLLGRPNGYTSRATFTVPGVDPGPSDAESCSRGGCIESWPDEAAAQTRVDYMRELAAKSPLLAAGYTYVRDELVLRVAGTATPAQATAVSKVFLG